MTIEDHKNFQREQSLTKIAAVITILASDRELYDLVSPFISVVDASIEWNKIFELPLSSQHRGACQWAYCIFKDEMPVGINPFDLVLGTDLIFRRAILKGLKMRWRA